ncbi:hypothetical protein B0H10DRAFT_1957408 [Mycena sp. CBHHK59/15]|nr:hypothetical protein B0H10DRAFT_1957408 [Mycena sp. CBHHK59/15]
MGVKFRKLKAEQQDMEDFSASPALSPLQPPILVPKGTEQLIFTLSVVIFSPLYHTQSDVFISAQAFAFIGCIDSTRVAWMNVDEREISDILRSNVALLAFHRDFLTEFLKSRILNSIFGTAVAGRLRKLFPSIRELSESIAVVRDTKEAWTTCNSNDLSAFIFEILAQLDVGRPCRFELFLLKLGQTLGLPTVENIGTKCHQTASQLSGLILTEDEISKLKVKEIHEQLEKHRTLWSPGMTVIPRNYRLKNKASKLHALRIAVAEHLGSMHQGSDMGESDTLVPGSRRHSAKMLDLAFDELQPETADVGMEVMVVS